MSGGGGHPKDNSVQLAQQQHEYALQAQQAADAKAAEDKTHLADLRSDAMSSGRIAAENYFNQQGADPSKYSDVIGNLINSIAGGISESETNPGQYYKDAGQQAYNTAETAGRTKATGGLDALFAPNFEYTRVADTTDDPFLASIDAEQRADADKFLNNLRARGVITEGGYAAGAKDLDRQNAGVMARLNEIGATTLETGRQNLRDIANRGRTAASGLKLGTQFDPNTYGSQVDTAFSDFLTNLGSTLRGKVQGNLFDTSGLPVIAGAAQGAGNAQAYDPKALAGIFDTEDEDKTNTNRTSPATGVF